MRVVSFVGLIVGVLLIPTAFGVAKFDRDRDVSELERTLVAETDEHGGALESYFARARAISLLTANSPAFANVLAEPGTRVEKVRRQSREHRARSRITSGISSSSTRRASARRALSTPMVRSSPARCAARSQAQGPLDGRGAGAVLRADLQAAFGQVHQTRPYVSPDTKEWVIANASLIPQADGRKRAFVHFEVTVESFRRAMGEGSAHGKRV